MFKRNIILFFIKNKQKIIKLGIFILVLLFISFIATITLKLSTNTNSDEDNNKIVNEEQQTLIYGADISQEEYVKDEEIIDKFIQLCNNKKTKEAYNLITDFCKKAYYPTQKDFENLYYNKVFKSQNVYELQSWISTDSKNTYKIKITPDLFDKGIYDSNSYIEDYYTVITEGKEKKISINKYVNNIEINKQIQQDGITINVLNKDVYVEYEVYNIEIENNTNKTILLDSKKTTSGIYLLDNSNVRYSSFIYELSINDLTVKVQKSKNIYVKFNKYYYPENNVNKIVFNDIIKDYEKYKSVNNYTDKINLTVELD